jgi:hypothetical protein
LPLGCAAWFSFDFVAAASPGGEKTMHKH